MTSTVLEAWSHAAASVRAALRPTPLVRLPIRGVQAEVYAKLETMQPTGSFKVRGAIAAVAALGEADTRIVTASAGNHGLGTAYAATRLGVPATIFVPRSAPSVKIERLQGFDVDLRVEGDRYDDAEQLALDFAADHGRFVSAYNDPHVIAGQATAVAEVAEALDTDFTVVVPVGGGGLLSGTAIGAERAAQRIDVVGVETNQSQAFSAAVAAGRVVEVPVGPTIADGLAGNIEDGAITPGIAREYGVSLVDVGEDEIHAAVRQFAVEHGLVVEGSGAVGLAALVAGKVSATGPVVLVLTGRNITAERLAGILAGE
jgi:threonine dehydratase